MSVPVIGIALFVRGLTAPQKAVLVALAWHANSDGREAYPGVARLSKMTCYGQRTVRRTLGELREMGLIHVVRESRQHAATEYRLDLPEMHAWKDETLSRPATVTPLNGSGMPENAPDLPENTARPATVASDPSLNKEELSKKNGHLLSESEKPAAIMADDWPELLKEFAGAMSGDTFKMLFKDASFDGLNGDCLRILVANQRIAESINMRLNDSLAIVASSWAGQAIKVKAVARL